MVRGMSMQVGYILSFEFSKLAPSTIMLNMYSSFERVVAFANPGRLKFVSLFASVSC